MGHGFFPAGDKYTHGRIMKELQDGLTLIAMRGWPSSGKSTRARELADQTGAAVVNRDLLRLQILGQHWTGKKEDEDRVTIAEDAMVKAFLKAGVSVIVDAQHVHAPYLRKWARLASRHGASLRVEDVRTPLEECIARDHARMERGERYVGEKVIRDQAKRFPMEKWPAVKADPPFIVAPAPEWDDRPFAVIFDLDGTAAIHQGRSPFNYSRVSEDAPNNYLKWLLCAIDHTSFTSKAITFIACSGRDDTCREDTEAWLNRYEFPYDMLLMRDTEGDKDSHGNKLRDVEVKYRLYNENIRDKYDVLAVFDDRLQVAELWHALGLPLYRVGDPNADF